jgi:hypothetical protein
VANEPGSFNQNHFALVVDEELKAECLYYTESTNSSLGLETNFNHVSGDTVWVVNGFSGELPIGDTTLYSLGGTTFIAKTCMGCEELIRLDVPFVAKQEVQFDVYPNPASQTVRVGIQGSSHKPQSITFIDMLGHALLHHKTTANENNIDISGLASGLYIVAATFENGEAARQRVVVQH